MVIGAYFCGSLLVFSVILLLHIWWGKAAREEETHGSWLLKFGIYSLILSVSFFVVYFALAVGGGVLSFGKPVSSNVPSDYLMLGLYGWFTLAVGVFGVLSAGIGAWLASK